MKCVSLLGVLAGMTLFSHAAAAACPGVFNGLLCNGTTGYDNCKPTAAGGVLCDFTGSATTSINAFFVSPTSTTFRSYGYDHEGEAYCCEISVSDGCSGGNPIGVEIYGKDYPDTLRLEDPTAGLYMDCSTTEVYGDAGDDFIAGSPATTNLDLLYGEGGSDSIHGDDGDDIIHGGDGDDIIYGEDGDDWIYGGYGDDRIKAGAGEDHAWGDGDTDKVCGGDDADYVYGGDGDGDRVCGEGSTDYINSGGAGSADGCENDNPDGTCEGTGQSACPW